MYIISLPLSAVRVALKLELGRLKLNKNIIKPVVDRVSTRFTRFESIGKTDNVLKASKKTVKNAAKGTYRTARGVDKILDNVRILAVRATIKMLGAVIRCIRFIAAFLGVSSLIMMVITIMAVLILVGAATSIVIWNNSNTTKSNTNTKQHLSYSGNKSKTTSSMSATAGDPVKACKQLAEWYIKNIHTYGGYGRHYYTCPLFKESTKVGDDCTSFACAYVSLVAGKKKVAVSGFSCTFVEDKNFEKTLNSMGWKKYDARNISPSDLKGGDILATCSHKGKGHHAEVYLTKTTSFGWGKVQTKYPSSTTQNIKKTSYGLSTGSHDYTVVWRYTG